MASPLCRSTPNFLSLHLFHFFRAKRIQNRAVVNESPTERLVKELKAENARLLQRLSRLGQEGRRANDETSKNQRLNAAEWDSELLTGRLVSLCVQRSSVSCWPTMSFRSEPFRLYGSSMCRRPWKTGSNSMLTSHRCMHRYIRRCRHAKHTSKGCKCIWWRFCM